MVYVRMPYGYSGYVLLFSVNLDAGVIDGSR